MFAYINALALTPRRQTCIIAIATALSISGSAFAQQAGSNNRGGGFSADGSGNYSARIPGANRYPCLVTRSCRRTNCECRIRSGKRTCRYPTVLSGSLSYRVCRPKG